MYINLYNPSNPEGFYMTIYQYDETVYTGYVIRIWIRRGNNYAQFQNIQGDTVAYIEKNAYVEAQKNFFVTDGTVLSFESEGFKTRFDEYFTPIESYVPPEVFYPGTLQLQATRLVYNNQNVGTTNAVLINYEPIEPGGDALLNLHMEFLIPGIFTVDDKKYLFDGDPDNIALYQDYDGIRLQNPAVNIELYGESWKISWDGYADGTLANRTREWNWLCETVYNSQHNNQITDTSSPSYYILAINLRPTNADDIVDALADLGTSISTLNDSYNEIKNYVPPAASGVQTDSAAIAAAADSAAAVIPEVSTAKKEQFENVQQNASQTFSSFLSGADVEPFGTFFAGLFENDWFLMFVVVPAVFVVFAALIKWAAD